MTTKMKLGFLLLVLLFAMPFMLACDDSGDVQDAGRDAVNTVLFETSKAEQAVQQAVDANCDPAVSVTQCQHALP